MASIPLPDPDDTTAHPLSLSPTEIYDGSNDVPDQKLFPTIIKLRIGTGGAGQSGLIRALAEAYLRSLPNNFSVSSSEKRQPELIAIAWYASDTTQSFNYLAQNAVDLSITYHGAAEELALRQGVADRREYCWRDHWMLVGPKSNPANLQTGPSPTAQDLFAQLFIACTATQTSPEPVRFLSRYDSSACNIKESLLWTQLGQTPWAPPVAPWYHRSTDFPLRALESAAKLGEYTLTDKGSWNTVGEWVRESMQVFIEGGDESESDPLLNPARALVGTHATNKSFANDFLDWVVRKDGGQEVIRTFKAKNGVVLYTPAP